MTLSYTDKAIFDTTSSSLSLDKTQITLSIECFDRGGNSIFTDTKIIDIVDPIIDIWVDSISIANAVDVKK
jgi:hypothetical protein